MRYLVDEVEEIPDLIYRGYRETYPAIANVIFTKTRSDGEGVMVVVTKDIGEAGEGMTWVS